MLLPLHSSSTTTDTVSDKDRVSKEKQQNPTSHQKTSCLNRLKGIFLVSNHTAKDITQQEEIHHMKKIEDYPSGCPRFAALIASHDSFAVCRRFSYLRARLLLQKQDRLVQLESKLDAIDREEKRVLFLSSNRLDRNEERRRILKDINDALADYDAFIEQTSRIMKLSSPQARDITNLRNWIEGNPCLARHQTTYITDTNIDSNASISELAALASSDDRMLPRVEIWIKNFLIRFFRSLYRQKCSTISSDPRTFISSGHFLRRAARSLIASLILAYLLIPVIICNYFDNVTGRLAVIIAFTVVFIASLSGLMKAKTVELVIAGSAYATVLTVFITNTK